MNTPTPTPAPTCPTCQAPADDTSNRNHCHSPTCIWVRCKCGTIYNRNHYTTDYYPRADA